ncbi:Mucin-5B [Acipenser ruthenus]|uniref:Mucin-5B n=1 Tax=Acipenser ruthenus TaxID=7906 RepID=A0A444U4F4_ACIRT|nr:Mucin-5B [Acipenser ruthenus]
MTSCDRTCRSLSEPDYTCKVKFVPVDGCGCAEGTYMDEGGRCVPPASCPCYNKGSVVSAGEVINRDGALCTCKQGKLNCIGESAQPSCAAPMVYFDCSNATQGARGSECQKSCQTLDMECYSTECASGCVCPQGLLSDDKGGCVSENQCPCIHNGASYKPGETIKADCNTCTCKDRRWQCTDNQCQGTCAIYGDGHYITFDGKRFSFNGDCEYTLTQDYCSGNSANGTFRVITENIPCGTTGTTCSKAIKLFLGNNELILSEGHYQVVQRDSGEDVPYKISTMGIYMVIQAKNGLILMWDKKTSMFIKLSPNFQFDNKQITPAFSRDGIQISSTGIDMSVEIPEINAHVSFRGLMFVITLPYSLFHGNTEGQCGICDNNKTNDCSGPNQVVESCSDSAHDWRINKTGCSKPTPPPTVRPSTTAKTPSKPPSPASSTPPSPDSKASICEIIYSKVFEACNEKIPAQPFYEACYFDVCHMPGTRIGCSSLEVYASMCEAAGVCMDWRKYTNGKCNYSCPPTKEYRACGPDVQPTCNSKYNEKYIDQNPSDSSGFTEGCFCPNGTTLFNSVSDVCVSSCGEQRLHNPGETWQSNCQDCVCDRDSMSVQCKPHVCTEESPVTCSKEGQERVTEIDSQCCNKTLCKCNVDLCPKTQQSCDPGFKLEISPPEDGCCLKHTCLPKDVCVFNNTEYQPGQVWTSPDNNCTKYKCDKNKDQLGLTEINIFCPPFNAEDCIPGTLTPDPDSCCLQCIPKPNNKCNIEKQKTKIVSNGCHSNSPVELTSCGGSCGTYSMYSSESNSMMHSCTCCRETKTSEKTITLSCPDSTTVDYSYIYVEECGCQNTECVDNNTTSVPPRGQEVTEDLRARRRRK